MGAVFSGLTPAEIEKQCNVEESTVRYTVKQASSRPNGVSKPRSGRPKSISIRDQRHIIRIARLEPKITYRDLQEKTGIDCHRKTIYRILKNYGLTNWLAKKRPQLTPAVAAKRYAWCWERKDWTYEQWELYIWSDECSVERGSGKRRQWVFRMPNERWNQNMIQPYKKGHDVSVMVWAAFWGKGRSDLVKLSKDFAAKKMGYSANSYVEVLEDNLKSIWEPGLIFMQDNAPIHMAKKVGCYPAGETFVLVLYICMQPYYYSIM